MQPQRVRREWVVVETGEGKVLRPEQDGVAERVRKRNEGAISPLPDPGKKSPS